MNAMRTKPIVLIVDDSPINITVLHEVLHDDYEVLAATNGMDALEIMRDIATPDLILLDVEMPGIDGYEVCKKLKNDSKTNTIPIIFVTAKNSIDDEAYGFNIGAVDYISKPFNDTIVKARVKTHVGLKLLRDQLEELSMIDGLARIPNRRYFDENYARAYKEASRDHTNLALLMIDVDYFKPYNDHYGHGQGDECLIKIAAALQSAIKRPTDFVARYGGEEFIVVVKNIDAEGVKTVAQNLLKAVADLRMPHEYSSVADHVTISVGVTYKEESDSMEEFLKRSDDALYRAKEGGRNRFSEEVKGEI